jgi:hypothetical protein
MAKIKRTPTMTARMFMDAFSLYTLNTKRGLV